MSWIAKETILILGNIVTLYVAGSRFLSAGYVKVEKLQGTDITVHKPHLSYAYAWAYEGVADNPTLVTVYK